MKKKTSEEIKSDSADKLNENMNETSPNSRSSRPNSNVQKKRENSGSPKKQKSVKTSMKPLDLQVDNI
jgi:hypothetical protein